MPKRISLSKRVLQGVVRRYQARAANDPKSNEPSTENRVPSIDELVAFSEAHYAKMMLKSIEKKEVRTPYERTRSLVQTKQFLHELCSLDDAIPLTMLLVAQDLLRHYPSLTDIEIAHKSNPDTFGPVPPFSRMSGAADVQGVIDATKPGQQE